MRIPEIEGKSQKKSQVCLEKQDLVNVDSTSTLEEPVGYLD